jgi:hypothetical protein
MGIGRRRDRSRAAKFKIELESNDETNSINVSELTVHVKEVA